MAMMDKVLELKVLNVKPFHYDSLLGSSKMDLGVVYSQPHHSYHSKWLLLSDMKNEDGHGRVISICSLATAYVMKNIHGGAVPAIAISVLQFPHDDRCYHTVYVLTITFCMYPFVSSNKGV